MTRSDASRRHVLVGAAGAAVGLTGCLQTGESGRKQGADDESTPTAGRETTAGDGQMERDGAMEPTDPGSAERVAIDRFSDDAGTLFVRSNNAALPGPDEPIDFDQGPFITRGLGPDGEDVTYYNFDVQPTAPAPIWVPFREGEDTPVADQLNIVDVVPGDDGYNDFWQVFKVTVPADYEANTLTSAADVTDAGYDVTPTDNLVNCPIVPDGSSATNRYADGDAELVEGWYRGQLVSYFTFKESSLTASEGAVPTSPIYVSFNVNPGQEGGGPASGFMTEDGNDRTHNVVATDPMDPGYSPLWSVNPYDNADFSAVSDLDSATAATILDRNVATVNCPVVAVDGGTGESSTGTEAMTGS